MRRSREHCNLTTRHRGRIRAVVVGLCLTLGHAGCQEGTVPDDIIDLVSLVISPQSPTLRVGETEQLSATVRDSAGNPVSNVPVTWSTSPQGIVTVDAQGIATAVSEGAAEVTATASDEQTGQSVSGATSITVIGLAVAAVEVAPASGTLDVGETLQLAASRLDSDGGPVDSGAVVWTSSADAVATVNSDGLVTAEGPGTADIVATVSENTQAGEPVADTAAIVVNAPPAAGDPELPREVIRFTPPAPTGTTRTVLATDGMAELQAAVNASVAGDEVVIESGFNGTGKLTLPDYGPGPTDWITIRGDAPLPAFGERLSEAQKANLPKITMTAPSAVTGIDAETNNAKGWWITGIALEQSGISSGRAVAVGTASDRIVLDRSAITVPGTDLGTDELRDGFRFAGSNIMLIGSRIVGIRRDGSESHAVSGFTGPGPWRVHNNFLEAASIGFLSGGAQPAGGVNPADIEFTNNHVYKRPSWFGVAGLAVKNAFELKNAQRVLAEGNVMEGTWPQGQAGYIVLLKSVDQGGAGCTTCATLDVTFRRNRIINAVNGFNLTAVQEGPAIPMARVLIEDVILEQFGNDGDYGTGANDGRAFLVGRGIDNLAVRRFTSLNSAENHSWMYYTATSLLDEGILGIGLELSSLRWGPTGGGIFGESGATMDDIYEPTPRVFADIWVVENSSGDCRNTTGDAVFDAAHNCVASAGEIPAGVGANVDTVEAATAGVREASPPP